MTILVYCRGCGKKSSDWIRPETAIKTPYCGPECKRQVQNAIKNTRAKTCCRLCGTRIRSAQKNFMAQPRLNLRGKVEQSETPANA